MSRRIRYLSRVLFRSALMGALMVLGGIVFQEAALSIHLLLFVLLFLILRPI